MCVCASRMCGNSSLLAYYSFVLVVWIYVDVWHQMKYKIYSMMDILMSNKSQPTTTKIHSGQMTTCQNVAYLSHVWWLCNLTNMYYFIWWYASEFFENSINFVFANEMTPSYWCHENNNNLREKNVRFCFFISSCRIFFRKNQLNQCNCVIYSTSLIELRII